MNFWAQIRFQCVPPQFQPVNKCVAEFQLAESSAFAKKMSKSDKWTFKEVMATLRLIEIKSICEACRNPFWLPAEQLAKVVSNQLVVHTI